METRYDGKYVKDPYKSRNQIIIGMLIWSGLSTFRCHNGQFVFNVICID